MQAFEESICIHPHLTYQNKVKKRSAEVKQKILLFICFALLLF